MSAGGKFFETGPGFGRLWSIMSLFSPIRVRCALPAVVLAGAVFLVGAEVRAAQPSRADTSAVDAAFAEPEATQLRALATAAEAEFWLERHVPEGFTLGDAPEFFEAADEVFFNAEEGLLIFAYRSALTGKWIAWVAFDAQGAGVVHTAAIGPER